MSAGSFDADEDAVPFVETSTGHEVVDEADRQRGSVTLFVSFQGCSASLAEPVISGAVKTLVCLSTLVLGMHYLDARAQSTDPVSGTQQVETIHYRFRTSSVRKDYVRLAKVFQALINMMPHNAAHDLIYIEPPGRFLFALEWTKAFIHLFGRRKVTSSSLPATGAHSTYARAWRATCASTTVRASLVQFDAKLIGPHHGS